MKKYIPSISLFTAVILFISNCATTTPVKYRHTDEYHRRHSDFPLKRDVYQIWATGSSRESQEKVFLIGMIRCAETALENGYKYFYILDYSGDVSVGYSYIPGTSITNYRFSKGIGNSIYGSSTTQNIGGRTVSRRSYSNKYLIKLVHETEEGQEEPYEANFIIMALEPKLEEIVQSEKAAKKGTDIAMLVLLGAFMAMGVVAVVLVTRSSPEEYPYSH